MASTASPSTIWVVGESTGVDGETGAYGDAIPEDKAAADVDALHDRLVASGVLPD